MLNIVARPHKKQSERVVAGKENLMNLLWLNNAIEHPKTSIAGVLTATVTVAGVLSQQGVTLGHAGTGTVITLISALTTALLGLVAQDPSTPRSAK